MYNNRFFNNIQWVLEWKVGVYFCYVYVSLFVQGIFVVVVQVFNFVLVVRFCVVSGVGVDIYVKWIEVFVYIFGRIW